MICSIPTVKSGSTWLDRLRSTKGFPTADGLDLGHFLLSNNNNQNSSPEPDPNPNPTSPESTQSEDKRAVAADNRKQISTGRNGGVAADDGGGGGGESEWFGIMSNVLSDLFNMNNGGEVDRRRRKKSLRKQRNPRICLVPTAAVEAEAVEEEEEEEEEERSSGGCERKDENALAENNNAVDCEEEKEDEDESGGGERELLGFSRNEVTVIDTSCGEWKFEKLVYRKRNVWKVREKKGKSKFVGRKRRKGGGGSEDGKKKMKVSNENVGVGGEGGGGGCVSPLKNGQSPQDDKSGEVGKGLSDDLSQVPLKRASLSRLRKKTKMASSSVVLIKGSPTSNKTKSHKSHGSRPEFEQRETVCNKPLLATFLKGKESGNGR